MCKQRRKLLNHELYNFHSSPCHWNVQLEGNTWADMYQVHTVEASERYTLCKKCTVYVCLHFPAVYEHGDDAENRTHEVTGEWRKLHNEELHDLYS
jgi:hypothetical protein